VGSFVEAKLPRLLILREPEVVLDRNPPRPLLSRLRDHKEDRRGAAHPVVQLVLGAGVLEGVGRVLFEDTSRTALDVEERTRNAPVGGSRVLVEAVNPRL